MHWPCVQQTMGVHKAHQDSFVYLVQLRFLNRLELRNPPGAGHFHMTQVYFDCVLFRRKVLLKIYRYDSLLIQDDFGHILGWRKIDYHQYQ